MVIWVVWFIYYGMLFLNSLFTFQDACAFLNTHALFWVRCGVDFTTSCLLFLIYLTLNNVTVAKRFGQDYHSFDFGIGFSILLVAVIIIGTFLIYCASMAGLHCHMFAPMLIVSLTLGIFSTFTFVLMLGKLNSFYLQIPIFLNIMVYLYAIAQIFTPLDLLANGWQNLRNGFVITTMPLRYMERSWTTKSLTWWCHRHVSAEPFKHTSIKYILFPFVSRSSERCALHTLFTGRYISHVLFISW